MFFKLKILLLFFIFLILSIFNAYAQNNINITILPDNVEHNDHSHNKVYSYLRNIENVSLNAKWPVIKGQTAQQSEKSGFLKSHQLKSDEYVMFLPDIAYQADDGAIYAGIKGWVYEKELRPGLTKLLALFLGIDISELTENQKQQLYDRTQLFRVDSERGKRLVVKDKYDHIFALPLTESNGRTNALLKTSLLPLHTTTKMHFNLYGSGSPVQADEAVAFYAPPTGLSIVTDIDDTIKISSVGDTKQLLINTFLEDFISVEGMSSWYKKLNKDGKTSFHYVSSSPIQLYPALIDFLNKYEYPLGSMHLREATHWKNIIASKQTSIEHKVSSIEYLLKAYPKRIFILIGDSGENDPMIYANLMRSYPKQIKAILIRDVTPNKKLDYYQNIFSGLSSNSWLVTQSVKDMEQFANKVILPLQ